MRELQPHHKIVLPIRLSALQQRWVYGSFALSWLSGVLWLLFHYFLQVDGAYGPQASSLEPWWLRLHGLIMFIILPVIGTTLAHHAHRAWRLGKNMTMGAVMGIHLCWLAASGYALYYFASEANEAWLPIAHWLPGLCLPLIIFAHVYIGRARATSRNARRRTNDTQSTLIQEPGR